MSKVEIREIGKYWSVNSDGFLVNDHKEKELSSETQKIISILKKEIFEQIPYIHSIYLGGSYLTESVSEFSDINFMVLIDNLPSWYAPHYDVEAHQVSDDFEIKIQDITKNNLNIDLKFNIRIENPSFFKYDLLCGPFTNKCVWGTDLSISKLDFNLIHSGILDGLESEDHQYLRKSLNEILLFLEYIPDNQIFIIENKIRSYLKLLLRCCFNTVCKDLKLWTRDLYYCYYFFSKQNPDLEINVKNILDLFLNLGRSSSEIKIVLLESEKLIEHIILNS